MTFDAFAGLAGTFRFEEPAKPEAGQFGLLVREPVGWSGRSSRGTRRWR